MFQSKSNWLDFANLFSEFKIIRLY